MNERERELEDQRGFDNRCRGDSDLEAVDEGAIRRVEHEHERPHRGNQLLNRAPSLSWGAENLREESAQEERAKRGKARDTPRGGGAAGRAARLPENPRGSSLLSAVFSAKHRRRSALAGGQDSY